MKIVLVEDNPEDCESIRSVLEARRETVVAFKDGEEAWSFVQDTTDIDVIIVSLDLKDMFGLDICWNTRIIAAQRKAMYVIAIAEHANKDIVVEALDSGADDFLPKPLQEEVLVARLRVAERITMLQKQLVQFANRDSLTNIYNRRAFMERTQDVINRARETWPISAIMFDIDHFKSVNDKFGHDAGDEVIRVVAKIAQAEGSLLGRLGGEEFALVLKNRTLREAAYAAERIRSTIATTPILINGHSIRITSSFGVARFHPKDNIDILLKRADIALYHSKNGGRNIVSVERNTAFAKRAKIAAQ